MEKDTKCISQESINLDFNLTNRNSNVSLNFLLKLMNLIQYNSDYLSVDDKNFEKIQDLFIKSFEFTNAKDQTNALSVTSIFVQNDKTVYFKFFTYYYNKYKNAKNATEIKRYFKLLTNILSFCHYQEETLFKNKEFTNQILDLLNERNILENDKDFLDLKDELKTSFLRFYLVINQYDNINISIARQVGVYSFKLIKERETNSYVITHSDLQKLILNDTNLKAVFRKIFSNGSSFAIKILLYFAYYFINYKNSTKNSFTIYYIPFSLYMNYPCRQSEIQRIENEMEYTNCTIFTLDVSEFNKIVDIIVDLFNTDLKRSYKTLSSFLNYNITNYPKNNTKFTTVFHKLQAELLNIALNTDRLPISVKKDIFSTKLKLKGGH